MEKFKEIFDKIYEFLGSFWSNPFTEPVTKCNQVIDFSSKKVIAHIPVHIFTGFIFAIGIKAIFSLFNYTSLQTAFIGFAVGTCVGLFVEIYQCFWTMTTGNFTLILQGFIDWFEYILGAAIILLF